MTDRIQGHLTAYSDLLKADIAAINKSIAAVDELIHNNDPHVVHQVLQTLTSYHLDTKWAIVPRQYQWKDWYLLAMHRFLNFAGVKNYTILTPEDREELTMVFEQLQAPGVFQFVENQTSAGGVYFVEMGTQEKLFYWSLERKELFLNSHALTSLLVSNYRAKDTADNIRTVADVLRDFGRYMETTFNYQVDYNVLETADNYQYNLVQTEMPAGMLDRLFVLSAESNYFLQAVENGAAMLLDHNVEIQIFFDDNPRAIGGQEWHFKVLDGHDAYSWMDVLLDYDFIGTWYLKERRTIEVASQSGIFEDGLRPMSMTKVQVEVLQPSEEG